MKGERKQMKELLKSVFLWCIILCLIPVAAASTTDAEAPPPNAEESSARQVILPSLTLKILNEASGEINEISIEEYTVYAVLAEIPFIMNDEAMKAQAIAARTYAVRRLLAEENDRGAHITNNAQSYQICLTDEEARQFYNTDYSMAIAAAKKAAKETEGQIILYNGSPIIAAFHTANSGITESAENVWGKSEPYLVPVLSEGDKYSPYFNIKKEFTYKELSSRISAEFSEAAAFNGITLTATPSGTVQTAELCGITLSGHRLAQLLTLDSASFTAADNGTSVTFTSNGIGHMAGMSMYGADYMAQQGYSCEEILSHYYQGTNIGLCIKAP